MRFTRTTEPCSAISRGERLPFASTWMELGNIALSDISLAEKAQNHAISLTGGI